MKRIKILKQRADAIAKRMKVLGVRHVREYITELIKHDLWIQVFRERWGIIPFSAHRITWIELVKLVKNKIRVDIKNAYHRWRYGDD